MQEFTTARQALDTFRHSIHQITEQTVLEAVDGVLKDIPNGAQYRGQFQQAISTALSTLRHRIRSELGEGIPPGGTMGERPAGEPPPPGH